MRTVLARPRPCSASCWRPALAAAQSWPQKPIKMIVPFPAGGGTDFIGRVAAKHLSTRLGQQVVVENRGGANGAIGLQGADAVRSRRLHDRDLLRHAGGQSVALRQAALSGAARLRAGGDLGAIPGMLAVHPSVPGADRGRADRARQGEARRARLCVGRRRQFQPSGDGAVLAGDRREAAARAGQGHRPCLAGAARGRRADGVQQRADLAAERARRQLRGAVAEPQRVPVLPDVPTVAETVPGFTMAPWIGHHRPGQDAEGDRGAARRRRWRSCAIPR